MRIAGTHLGHCTNVHPGETWPEVRRLLGSDVASVAHAVGGGPYGIGLRLSNDAACALDVGELRETLAEHGLYVFTLNGFPYGPFGAAAPVKTRVYQPDWRTEARVAYTARLAEIIAAIAPPDVTPTISTLPIGFAPELSAADDEAAARKLLELVPILRRIEDSTGRTVTIALEPEPWCRLETTADAIAFFEQHLFRAPLVDEASVRRFFGVCLDVCHLAVMFESPARAIAALHRSGITLAKAQLSVGLRAFFGGSTDPLPELRAIADPIFLHQVVERSERGTRKYLDLDAAISASDHSPRELRIHHHVPIHRERVGSLGTTRKTLLEALEALRRRPLPPLEIETYAFSALPSEHRDAPLTDEIAREVAFIRARLGRDFRARDASV